MVLARQTPLIALIGLLGCANSGGKNLVHRDSSPSATSGRAAEPESLWSNVSNGLQARLSFEKMEGMNGTPFIVTYLELRNLSDVASVLKVPLKLESIKFELRDETGKVVGPSSTEYDGFGVDLGTLRLPYGSTLRFNIAMRGAGVAKDQAALLDLGPLSSWTFPRRDKHTYTLSAKFRIEKRNGHSWAGMVEIPATPLPLLSPP